MKKKIKIGLLVSGFPPTTIGGAEIAAKNIAEYISKRNFEVHIITRNMTIKLNGKKYSLKKLEYYNGYVIHRFPCSKSSILRFITHVLFSLKLLFQIKPDIIHSQQITPNGLVAIIGGKILRKKTVVWAQGSEVYDSSLLYLKSIAQFIITNAHIVLSVSKDMTNRMKRIWPNISIFTLQNGIDLNKYFHNPLSKSSINLIYVGRLIKIKKVADALKALSHFKNNHPPITLTIIGTGPQEDPMKRLCHSLGLKGQVQFLGSIHPAKIPNYLANADIFVFPSLRESFGLAILEAMASELPILASRTTAIPELVHDGENGLLHSPGNISELVKNLKTLIEDATLRKSMGQKSREIARNYRWERIIDELIKLYSIS
ncbi:MAG: glycosyltransferase family 4 protein [Candidatus Helarchaeota archaeon]